MKIPYPDISSDLALKPHMYIYTINNESKKKFVKCQTFKPTLLGTMSTFIAEPPDYSRNPFRTPSIIDCDKLFSTNRVRYDERLRTTDRPDVCSNLYNEIIAKIGSNNSIQNISLNETNLIALNPLIKSL